MSDTVTLELPDDIAFRARDEAMRSHRRPENVVLGWLGRVVAQRPIRDLPDTEILDLCDLALAGPLETELLQLLGRQRVGKLEATERRRLAAIMAMYRRELVRKARATSVPVERGLRPELG